MTYPEVVFSLDPKAAVQAAAAERSDRPVEYCWELALAASALADKRMLKARGAAARGMHTEAVQTLLEPLISSDIEPAHADRFDAYDQGKVFAVWSRRNEYDKNRADTYFFSGRAKAELLDAADIDDEVRNLFKQTMMLQTMDEYGRDLAGGIAELIPNDNFPYREMLYPNQVNAYWAYHLQGDDNRPGLLEAAAAEGRLRKQWLAGLRGVYGPDGPEAGRYMMAVMYLRTSKLRHDERAREVVTPLVEVFNSRSVPEIREVLRGFCLERPEVVPDTTLGLFQLDRDNLLRARAERAAAERPPEPSSELIERTVYGSRPPRRFGIDTWDTQDGMTNSWVSRNRFRIFQREKKFLVLAGVRDKVRPGSMYSTLSPHLVFLWQDRKEPITDSNGYQIGRLKVSSIAAKDFQADLRRGKAIDLEMTDIPTLEKLAYAGIQTEAYYNHRQWEWRAAHEGLLLYLHGLREASQADSE